MKSARNYLAFDLGASSGRAILGRFDGSRLTLEEKHRFTNGPVEMNGRLYWNAPGLFEALKSGLAQCGQDDPASLGIDTWGVDYGIVSPTNGLVTLPVHYRDSRTDESMELEIGKAGSKIFDEGVEAYKRRRGLKGISIPDFMSIIKITPKKIEYLDTTLKAKGLGVRHILKY
jgi:sugar (pentulose or hexulose) kinase